MYGVTNGVLLYRIFQCIGYQSATSQWGQYNAYGTATPWKVAFPIKFSNTSFGVSINRCNGEYAFSEICISKNVEYFTYKDADYRNQSGVGDTIFWIAIGK